MKNPVRNELLRDLFIEQWATLEDIRASNDGISAPYLPWVHPDYERSDIRLVVVGKETNGWGDHSLEGMSAELAVDTLMGEYRDFALGTHYRGRASFWTPVHELYRRLNPDAPPLGFMALNASPLDLQGTTPDSSFQEAIIGTGLLSDEIRILEPDVVVFHTGPEYESWLDCWFPGLTRSGNDWLALIASTGLPALTFRTYHPRYLNYCTRRSAVYDRIVETVHTGVWVESET